MDERPSIAFIGGGRVAGVLAPAFAGLGYPVVAAASRSPESAQRVASLVPGCRAASPQDAADAADVVFVTTSDGAVADVASSVSWRAGQGVVHCSGALTCGPLAPARAAGASVGSWHPFQTFGGETTLAGVTFGIEAEGDLLAFLERLASEVGGHALRVPAEARALYHAASVLSCGYLTTLLGEARTLWTRAGLPPEQAFQAITHIARTTVVNVERFGAETALTGPTSRGDTGTVRLHLDAVRDVAPELLPLYREICLRSVELAREAGRAGGDMDLRPLFAEYHDGGGR
ncbi:MAG: DUF2520 domain-containing protein [Chloroflexota bacterium]|nr:DUF2520 domain-containing protein [Chloroflexota bacterium]MDE2885004.1 DUF2520 domain-containing protein [Chloroflexota bacterium]